MAAFVVVPAARGGAWSWNELVIPMLRREDHDVDRPRAPEDAVGPLPELVGG